MGVTLKPRALVVALILITACHKAEPPSSEPKDEKGGEKGASGSTPVKVVALERGKLVQVVSGPGRTVAFMQQKVRAPFSGTLTELRVVDGNRVSAGDVVGVIVSRDSEAALTGAREMLRSAKSDIEKGDAERAVALAERTLVKAQIKIPSAGVVLAHAASAGDRVSEDQELLTVSTEDSLVFQADIAQNELEKVHPGQFATISLSGRGAPLSGVVHDILANANAQDLTVPVRIDPRPQVPGLGAGLFGLARIVVGEKDNALVLPTSAVIRDDVTGTTQIATVTGEKKAHWVEVTTGLVDGEKIEIKTPPLPEGTQVIVTGQVGLPENTPVSVEK